MHFAPKHPPQTTMDSKERVLLWFFSHPEQEFTINEVVAGASISKTTAQRILTALEEEEFLKRRIVGRSHLLKNNTEHPYNQSRKIPYTLRQVYESGLLAHLKEKHPQARNMILFGSYADGTDRPDSDLDIAIEQASGERIHIAQEGTIGIAHRKHVPVNVLVFDRDHIDTNLFNSIANGIVLEGFLEVNT